MLADQLFQVVLEIHRLWVQARHGRRAGRGLPAPADAADPEPEARR
jgi:hypothetical protein